MYILNQDFQELSKRIKEVEVVEEKINSRRERGRAHHHDRSLIDMTLATFFKLVKQAVDE
jgi:hypothetical protein